MDNGDQRMKPHPHRSYFSESEETNIKSAGVLAISAAILLGLTQLAQIFIVAIQACRGSDDLARLVAFFITTGVCVFTYKVIRGHLPHARDRSVVRWCMYAALAVQITSVWPIDPEQVCPNNPNGAPASEEVVSIVTPTPEPTETPDFTKCYYQDVVVPRNAWHTVVEHENASCISWRAGLIFEVVRDAWQNQHIVNWDVIHPGDQIFIP